MMGWGCGDERVGVVRMGGLALTGSGGRGGLSRPPRRIFGNFFAPDFFGNALWFAVIR